MPTILQKKNQQCQDNTHSISIFYLYTIKGFIIGYVISLQEADDISALIFWLKLYCLMQDINQIHSDVK